MFFLYMRIMGRWVLGIFAAVAFIDGDIIDLWVRAQRIIYIVFKMAKLDFAHDDGYAER